MQSRVDLTSTLFEKHSRHQVLHARCVMILTQTPGQVGTGLMNAGLGDLGDPGVPGVIGGGIAQARPLGIIGKMNHGGHGQMTPGHIAGPGAAGLRGGPGLHGGTLLGGGMGMHGKQITAATAQSMPHWKIVLETGGTPITFLCTLRETSPRRFKQ
mmetsp:Transcript_37507/g.48289  ORF Transcript_37507/g.48289 Transcript_37507/m.48289 type:complete len:156 (+) Transcript_37507:347-814(+)